jgi:hypothetical protein
VQTARALVAQRKASDIQSVLEIWGRLDAHWVRFRSAGANKEKQKFEFGQLVGYYELACGLFRDKVFSTKAARTLEEHLDEILPAMRSHPTFDAFFETLRSKSETYANIHWFCDRNIKHRTESKPFISEETDIRS